MAVKIYRLCFRGIFTFLEITKTAIFKISRRFNHNCDSTPFIGVAYRAIAEHPMGSRIYTYRNRILRGHFAIKKLPLSPFPKRHTRFIALRMKLAGLESHTNSFPFKEKAFVISLDIHALFEDAVLENRSTLQNFDLFFKNLVLVFL